MPRRQQEVDVGDATEKEIPLTKQTIDHLKRRWLAADDEIPEPYILTKAEEDACIRHAIERAKAHYLDRRLYQGERLEKVEQQMDKIDWTQKINVAEVLENANANKNYDQWVWKKRQQERQAEIDKRLEIEKKYTARFLYQMMARNSKEQFRRDFQLDQENLQLISTICFFLSEDERFEQILDVDGSPYSLRKGLWIQGSCGLGKTFLFRCVKDNERNPITIYGIQDLADQAQEEGYKEIPLTRGKILLDDVGTEEAEVKHYGTKINFFKQFVEQFNLKHLDDGMFNKLIVLTNNDFDQIGEKYGFRARSLFKEMFNILYVTGRDRRK
jgi:hypothetical protein